MGVHNFDILGAILIPIFFPNYNTNKNIRKASLGICIYFPTEHLVHVNKSDLCEKIPLKNVTLQHCYYIMNSENGW